MTEYWNWWTWRRRFFVNHLGKIADVSSLDTLFWCAENFGIPVPDSNATAGFAFDFFQKGIIHDNYARKQLDGDEYYCWLLVPLDFTHLSSNKKSFWACSCKFFNNPEQPTQIIQGGNILWLKLFAMTFTGYFCWKEKRQTENCIRWCVNWTTILCGIQWIVVHWNVLLI